MSILVNKDTRVIVQGFTGSQGTLHSEQSIEYGTNIVGGVTPGKGGIEHLGKPVFNSVEDAKSSLDPNASIIFVPARFCKDSILESAEAGIKLIICITEGIPTLDMRDETQEDPLESEAAKNDLSYVSLDGNIGCMVNGAGLAMGTMDTIKFFGGNPANFLDVGGTATQERVAKAFKIILDDPEVKVVLVNIFGGIVRCDLIAEGIIAAIKEVEVKIPVVVRLEGNNADIGSKILSKAKIKIESINDLAEAAKKAVLLAK